MACIVIRNSYIKKGQALKWFIPDRSCVKLSNIKINKFCTGKAGINAAAVRLKRNCCILLFNYSYCDAYLLYWFLLPMNANKNKNVNFHITCFLLVTAACELQSHLGTLKNSWCCGAFVHVDCRCTRNGDSDVSNGQSIKCRHEVRQYFIPCGRNVCARDLCKFQTTHSTFYSATDAANHYNQYLLRRILETSRISNM